MGKKDSNFFENQLLFVKWPAWVEFESTPEQRERSTCMCIYFVAETYAKLKMTANYSRLNNGKQKISLDGPNREKFLENIEVIWFYITFFSSIH